MSTTTISPSHNWPALISLCLAIFMVNTSEFIPIGILPSIATSLDEQVAHTGLLVTGYAWIVAIMSLPLTIITAQCERKKLLLWLFIWFIIFNCLAAVAWSFTSLLMARIGTACVHAVFFAITIPLAFRQVPNYRKNLAMSLMIAASSLAIIIGVPLGTIVGNLLGWRYAFWLIVISAIFLIITIYFLLPKSSSNNAGSLSSLPRILQRSSLISIYALLVLTITGYFIYYTYITPFMQQIGGLTENTVISILLISGCAGLIGSLVFAKFYTNQQNLCISGSLITIMLCLAALILVQFSWFLAFVLAGLMSAAVTILASAFQTKVIEFAPDATDVATSLFSAIYNIGIGTGAFLGSQIIVLFSIKEIGLFGAGLLIIPVVFFILYAKDKIISPNSP